MEFPTPTENKAIRTHCPELIPVLDGKSPCKLMEHDEWLADQRVCNDAYTRAMKFLHQKAETDERGMTETEQTAWNGLEKLVRNTGEAKAATPVNAGNGSGPTWRTREGRDIRVLRPNDKLATHSRDDLTLGGFVRAMISGPQSEAERRALAEGTDSAGGFTVPSPLSGAVIDIMRAKSRVIQAGALTVPMTSQTLSIAKLATDPTTAWRAENAQISESDPTFSQVLFTAQSLVALVRASRELIEDSANFTQALERAFAGALAAELDRVALIGSGTSPEPEGIQNVTDVGAVSMGANGAAPTNYDDLLDCLQTLEDANAGETTAFVMAPRSATQYAKLKDSTNQPLQKPDVLARVPFLQTTQMPIDETKGSSTDASSVITGNFADCMIGIRSELRIETLKERYADYHQFGFLAHLRADVQLVHPESFVVLSGLIP